MGCGEDVDVFESSKPSLQNKKKKKKAQTQKISQVILRGTWAPWLRRVTYHKLELGVGLTCMGLCGPVSSLVTVPSGVLLCQLRVHSPPGGSFSQR